MLYHIACTAVATLRIVFLPLTLFQRAWQNYVNLAAPESHQSPTKISAWTTQTPAMMMPSGEKRTRYKPLVKCSAPHQDSGTVDLIRISQGRIRDFTRADVQSIWKGHRRCNVEGWRGRWGLEKGAVPPPQEFFLYFWYRNGELLCIPGGIYWHWSFQKGHSNQKGGCPDTLDTPWIRPRFLEIVFICCWDALRFVPYFLMVDLIIIQNTWRVLTL